MAHYLEAGDILVQKTADLKTVLCGTKNEPMRTFDRNYAAYRGKPFDSSDREISMKKLVCLVSMAMMLSACALKTESLQKQAEAWKPGLGEIMGVIQQHHAKLYYSANARNWALAEYQVGEIQEGLETAVRLYPQFKEVKELLVLLPAATKDDMENLSKAVKKKNLDEFLAAYNKLTNSCNACHNAANRGFIVIQAPTSLEFSNQEFEP